MPNAKVLLKAEAGRLGIEGYRQMTQDELQAAIDSAKGVTKGKGKSEPVNVGPTTRNGIGRENGASAAKGKTETKVSKGSPTKGKGKSAPAKKSTARKSSPAKATAAKGTAKRPTAAKTKTAATKGRTTAAKTKPAKAVKQGEAAKIDRGSIDWNLETNVGKTGKRMLVMNALRKYKGDYDKCYDALEDYALEWYPNAKNTYPNAPTKLWAAQLMVRWLINRVAYDYAMNTEQHQKGTRAAYGSSKADHNVARREERETLRKVREKAARARKAKAGTSGRGKPAKATGGRTAASRGKAATKPKGR